MFVFICFIGLPATENEQIEIRIRVRAYTDGHLSNRNLPIGQKEIYYLVSLHLLAVSLLLRLQQTQYYFVSQLQ